MLIKPQKLCSASNAPSNENFNLMGKDSFVERRDFTSRLRLRHLEMPFVDLFGGRLDLLLHGLGLAPHPLGLLVGPAGRKFRPEEGLGGEGVLRASVGLEQKSGQVFFQNCRLKRRGTEDMKPFL